MARIDKLIDEIIKRAQDAANGMFASYPGKVQTELLNTYLTDEECIRQLIKAEYEYKKGLRDEFYNVRNIKGVRLSMFMDISSGTWPVMGGKDMRSIRPHKMYNRVYHAILWPLFLSVKRIDYLKGLLKGYEKEGKTPDNSKDRVSEILDGLFPGADRMKKEAIWHNLNGIFQPVNLIYTGVKDRLWERLWDINEHIKDRRQVARVFSDHVYWKKTTTSVEQKLDLEDVYRHIERKRL
ncbi:MAG TPA: hypothetical protein PLJ84_04245 [Bacteroidales bacterium]|nr:hypothetical protein [Bacteroidales bacterium]